MNTIEERMGGYAAYHQDPRCKLTHLFGVPMVFYSPLIALGWLRTDVGGISISAAMVILAAVLIWYIRLDLQLGLLMTVISIPIAYFCDIASKMEFMTSLQIFLSIKVSGWVIQLVGHVFEGRRPALVDNLVQSLMGPLFVLAEVVFFFGFRKELREKVESLARAHAFPVKGEPASQH